MHQPDQRDLIVTRLTTPTTAGRAGASKHGRPVYTSGAHAYLSVAWQGDGESNKGATCQWQMPHINLRSIANKAAMS